MNLHIADLTHRLSDYLARRVPPKGIAGDERLRMEQMGEYVNVLRRYAPEGDRLTDWWREFTDRLSDESETWAWPTPKDISKAAKAAGEASKPDSGPAWKPDSVAVNLARLNDGSPIGEDWLWGAGALRLEAAGASRHVLRERRLQLARNMAEVYPDDEVRARLLALKARHEAAVSDRETWRRGQYDTRIPNKRVFPAAEMEALVE